MVRKIECPICNMTMHYTKFHEHQRKDECLKVGVIKKNVAPIGAFKINKKRSKKGAVKCGEKSLKKTVDKILKRAES